MENVVYNTNVGKISKPTTFNSLIHSLVLVVLLATVLVAVFTLLMVIVQAHSHGLPPSSWWLRAYFFLTGVCQTCYLIPLLIVTGGISFLLFRLTRKPIAYLLAGLIICSQFILVSSLLWI